MDRTKRENISCLAELIPKHTKKFSSKTSSVYARDK